VNIGGRRGKQVDAGKKQVDAQKKCGCRVGLTENMKFCTWNSGLDVFGSKIGV
jgi:hypothetical protein